MAKAEEKDKFWLWIGGLILVTIILVFTLKSRETEHLSGDTGAAIQESQAEQIEQIKNRRKNVLTEEN